MMRWNITRTCYTKPENKPSSSCTESHIANLGRFLGIRVRGSKIMCLPSQASPVFVFFPVNFSRKTLWLREDLSLHWVAATARFLAARSSSLVTWRGVQKLASEDSKVHSFLHNSLSEHSQTECSWRRLPSGHSTFIRAVLQFPI